MTEPILISSLVALFACLIFTPIVRRVALRNDFVDRPDGVRKIQAEPVALGGGYAVLVAAVLGIAVACNVNWFFDIPVVKKGGSLLGLCLGTVLIAIVGVIDDRKSMRGRHKLFWQVVAVSMVIFMGDGLLVSRLAFFGYTFHVGLLGYALMMIWLLGAINSLNLMDGTDGLAATVGLIFCVTLGVMAIMAGNVVDAMIVFAVGAALLGFLRYNFAPASIYLGDAGSMFIGLILGTIALRCSVKQAATLAFAGPLAIMAIPFFDSAAAVIRRKLTGRSIYATDRGHIHHRLLTRGLSPRRTVAIIAALCLVTSGGALASVYLNSEIVGIAAVLFVLCVLVGTRVIGHVELLLLNNRLMGFGRSLIPFRNGKNGSANHSSVQLQGSLEWETMWDALIESTERYNLVSLQLNLNLPRLHEDFYATWKSDEDVSPKQIWRTEMPLVVDGQAIGRLAVAGVVDADSVTNEISEYMEFVEPLQAQLQSFVTEAVDAHDAVMHAESSEKDVAVPPPAQHVQATHVDVASQV